MQKMKWWLAHMGAFLLGQAILLAVGESWPAAFLTQQVPDPLSFGNEPAMWISRAWCVVFAVDTIWSLANLARSRAERTNHARRSAHR